MFPQMNDESERYMYVKGTVKERKKNHHKRKTYVNVCGSGRPNRSMLIFSIPERRIIYFINHIIILIIILI